MRESFDELARRIVRQLGVGIERDDKRDATQSRRIANAQYCGFQLVRFQTH
jgi:hypothetical protein